MLQKHREPDLYGCRIGDTTIVLDISSEKYYAVSPDPVPAADTRACLLDNSIKSVGDLVNTADLTAIDTSAAAQSLNWAPLLILLAALLRIVLGRALFGTGALIRSMRRSKTQPTQARATRTDYELSAAIQLFRRVRPWIYTARNNCLFDALVFTDYLLRLGFDAVFVIGVRTRPFEAHAWTQVGTGLVDDLPERVQTFTPIVVA